MESFDWKNKIEIDGQIFPSDALDRSKYAKFLTEYLKSESNYRNFVLNLNAEWGSGKTYFLKRWYKELKQNHPVVYIDAWTQDFSDDPLLTTVGAIIEQLQELKGNEVDKKIIKTKKTISNLLKSTSPLIVKAIFKKITSVDSDDLLEAINSSNDFDSSEIAYQISEALINDHSQKTSSIKHFKTSIIEWIELITSNNSISKPAFIFIDELDRCRPNYAIEMLETIKHLFDMKDVVFIIGTDTHQLQHSVKVIYGNDFNAEQYLGRFFNRRLSLQKPNHVDFIKTMPQSTRLMELTQNSWHVMPYYQSDDEIIKIIAEFFTYYELDLRTSEKIIDQLISILVEVHKNNRSVNLIMLTALLCWKERANSFYLAVKDGLIKLNNPQHINDNTLKQYKTHRIQSKVKLLLFSQGLIIQFPETPNSLPESFNATYSEVIHCLYESLTIEKRAPAIRDRIQKGGESASNIEMVTIINEANHPSHEHLTWNGYLDLLEVATSFDS